MLYLIAATAALAIGPLLHFGASGRRQWLPVLDGLVIAAIPGLVFLEFVPTAVTMGNWGVLAALAAGFMVPWAIERATHRPTAEATARHSLIHRWALAAGLAGFLIHTAVDGGALATLPRGEAATLGSAIVLHRIPVGVAAWWLATREANRLLGALALVSITVATFLGFGIVTAGEQMIAVSGGVLTLFQAAVGGSLVHVVLHRSPSTTSARNRRLEGWGALVAVALLLAIFFLASDGPHAASGAFLRRLYVLAAESAPALLAAYVCAGFLGGFLPRRLVEWMKRAGPVFQAGRGAAIGLPVHVCSCGVVPLYRGLIQGGAPATAALAFLVATPAMGVDALLLSVPLLGAQMTVLRLAMVAMGAVFVGVIVGRRLATIPTSLATSPCTLESGTPVRVRIRDALRTGTGDAVHNTAPWIVLGLSVAALVAPILEGGWLATLPPVADVVLFALLGFLACFCAVSSTPLIATLLAAGLSPGAGIAFLMTGPSTNIATLGLVGGIHGQRGASALAGAMLAFAVVAGVAVNWFFGDLPLPSLSHLTEEMPGALHQACLALLALLFLRSLVQRGLRAFVSTLRDGMRWSHTC